MSVSFFSAAWYFFSSPFALFLVELALKEDIFVLPSPVVGCTLGTYAAAGSCVHGARTQNSVPLRSRPKGEPAREPRTEEPNPRENRFCLNRPFNYPLSSIHHYCSTPPSPLVSTTLIHPFGTGLCGQASKGNSGLPKVSLQRGEKYIQYVRAT